MFESTFNIYFYFLLSLFHIHNIYTYAYIFSSVSEKLFVIFPHLVQNFFILREVRISFLKLFRKCLVRKDGIFFFFFLVPTYPRCTLPARASCLARDSYLNIFFSFFLIIECNSDGRDLVCEIKIILPYFFT